LSAFDAAIRGAMRVAYRLQLGWWYVRRPSIQGAYVAVWHDGRRRMIRNSYRKRDSLPAGGVRRGETPLDAAVRELGEEVGIAVSPERLAYHGEILTESQYAKDHAHFFELHCTAEPEVQVDRREVVWAGFLRPEDALARGVVRSVRIYLEQLADRPSL
jgi:8-oxo-dGTP pyrophosphatase MutT (NUDIX family)